MLSQRNPDAQGLLRIADISHVGNPTHGSALEPCARVTHHNPRAPGVAASSPLPRRRGFGLGEWGRSKMKTRVMIEYNLPAGDCVALREREEQRWTASETVLSLPGSAMVKVELVERLDGRPLPPAM
jgi:hypothetical protein